ncbi:hypothetical protein BC628DRAFT_707387 [Trametes gibbosa]|nr:hypothetical protein BC628DRAFT_707387 [Trametes gibbosa]
MSHPDARALAGADRGSSCAATDHDGFDRTCTGPSGSTPHVVPFAELDTADATRQTAPVRPDSRSADMQGDAQEPPTSMKGSVAPVLGKGKANASGTSSSAITSMHPTSTSTSPPPDAAAQHGRLAPGNACGADAPRRPASGALQGADEGGLAGLAGALQSGHEPERDAEFYIAGADCVIRVEDTLFRVSAQLFSGDGAGGRTACPGGHAHRGRGGGVAGGRAATHGRGQLLGVSHAGCSRGSPVCLQPCGTLERVAGFPLASRRSYRRGWTCANAWWPRSILPSPSPARARAVL